MKKIGNCFCKGENLLGVNKEEVALILGNNEILQSEYADGTLDTIITIVEEVFRGALIGKKISLDVSIVSFVENVVRTAEKLAFSLDYIQLSNFDDCITIECNDGEIFRYIKSSSLFLRVDALVLSSKENPEDEELKKSFIDFINYISSYEIPVNVVNICSETERDIEVGYFDKVGKDYTYVGWRECVKGNPLEIMHGYEEKLGEYIMSIII